MATKKKAKKTTKSPVKAAKKSAAKKPAAKKSASKKPMKAMKLPVLAKKTSAKKAAPAKKAVVRRDGTGHLSPKMAQDLRRRSKASRVDDNANAFLKGTESDDDLAETLGEETVTYMTGGENVGEDVANEVTIEELGGPFVRTSGKQEFARGTDASNPRGSKREPFPRA